MPFIYTALKWLVGYAIGKFFLTLGVGMFTFSIVQYFFKQYVNSALSSLGSVGHDFVAYMGICQLDNAISVYIGALTVKAFIRTVKTGLGFKK